MDGMKTWYENESEYFVLERMLKEGRLKTVGVYYYHLCFALVFGDQIFVEAGNQQTVYNPFTSILVGQI